VVEVAFQSIFFLEMHQNYIFFIFKKFIFDISTSKRSKNTKKKIKAKTIHVFSKARLDRNAKQKPLNNI
jgi:hypothetical protein